MTVDTDTCNDLGATEPKQNIEIFYKKQKELKTDIRNKGK